MPAVGEDDVVLPNQAAHLLSNLNAATGQQLWQDYPISSGSQPAIANGIAYVGDYELKAINLSANTVIWQSAYLLYDGSPVLANGLVYDTSNVDGALDAFAAAGCGQPTCNPVWTYTPTGGFYGTPAVANGSIYLGGSQLTVLNATTGALEWTAAITSKETIQTTIVDNGVVYFVANSTYNGGTLYAFNAAGCGQVTCSPLWTAHNASGWGYSPAAAYGSVYIGGKDNTLSVFAEAGCGAATCSPTWTGAAGGAVWSPPAIANGVVYVASYYPGAALAFNAAGCGAASCQPLWTYRLSSYDVYLDAPLTIANGVLYFSDDSGTLRAFHLPSSASRCPSTSGARSSGARSSGGRSPGVVCTGVGQRAPVAARR